MSIKAILLDLDDVLIHEGFEPPIICDETIQVLNYLKENNYKIVLVSHNDNGRTIIDQLNILHYFTGTICYWANTKFFHFISALEILKLKGEECLLCDDLVSNIQMATTLNIHGLLVDNKFGISLKQLKNTLDRINTIKS